MSELRARSPRANGSHGDLPPDQPRPLGATDLVGLLRWTLASDRRLSPPDGRGRLPVGALPRLRRPVFLLGAPRSGTTFLGECVAAVPEISYHHEPVATKAGARKVYTGEWSPTRARWWFRLTYGLLLAARAEGHLRFAEKTPQNCFLVGFLADSFPDAQFVHIVRDGRDSALSYRDKSWLAERYAGSGRREPGGYSWGPYPRFWVEPERTEEFRATSDLHRTIWAWRRFTEAALDGLAALPAGRVHELRYESLVARPEAEAGRLATFLGVDTAPSRAALDAACRQGVTTSVGRWREQLDAAGRAVVRQEAGALLDRLGYPED